MTHFFIPRKDIDKFLNSTRVLVYNMFGSKDENGTRTIADVDMNISSLEEDQIIEMDRTISFSETQSICQPLLKKTNKGYVISEKGFMNLIESMNARMVSNILMKLCADGVLESAFSEETNDFVFWTKNNANEEPKEDQ